MVQDGTADELFNVLIFLDFIVYRNELICFNQIFTVILGNGVVVAVFMENKPDFSLAYRERTSSERN